MKLSELNRMCAAMLRAYGDGEILVTERSGSLPVFSSGGQITNLRIVPDRRPDAPRKFAVVAEWPPEKPLIED